jgi:alpha-ketoglutarate-dependent taurine dioxygenase
MGFGIRLEGRPIDYHSDALRGLLSRHGVIYWRGVPVEDMEQHATMAKLGMLQGFRMQRAPKEYADPADSNIIHLRNDDFLGKSRMGWHMDQTYSKIPYLPIRSLYCSEVEGRNVTQFADIGVVTDVVLERYPHLENAIARYHVGGDRSRYNTRPVFEFCQHVDRKLLRYDNRMELEDGTDSVEFKRFCIDLLDSDRVPRLSIEWEPFDFVIFDNNQCPHRRSYMSGECKLKRITSMFWLNKPEHAILMLRND